MRRGCLTATAPLLPLDGSVKIHPDGWVATGREGNVSESNGRDIDAQIERRINGILEWLEKEHPNVFREQRHLDKGTTERAYWHYGYSAALRDVAKLIDRDQ